MVTSILRFLLVLLGIHQAVAQPFPVQSTPRDLTSLMERELKGCFDFFWYESITNQSWATHGMTSGDYVGLGKYSPVPIENQGFYLAIIVSGVERHWITRAEGEARALSCLDSLLGLKHFRGFFYHFIDPETGLQGWKDPVIELSNMSTATMLAGAIIAGEYFGGEIRDRAMRLYERTDWKWFQDPKVGHFYLAGHPEFVPQGKVTTPEGFFGHWGAYSERLLMDVLGAGAPRPEFSTSDVPYRAMIREVGSYRGEPFIYCTTGSAFTYQWTHAFVDFRNIVDDQGTDWHRNSVLAARAARQFAIDQSQVLRGVGPNSWGFSASMSPTTFYSGRYGSLPAGKDGRDPTVLLLDGTVAPYASSAFVVHTPAAALSALEHMYAIPELIGKYGLYDAYSFHTGNQGDRPWVAGTWLGIDKGLVALMFENYATQLHWRLFMQNPHIQRGLKTLGFRGK